MSDSFIYPCLSHLLNIIDSKQQQANRQQDFYHTHILVTHFIQSKQLFQNNSLFYQTILNFYQQRVAKFQYNRNGDREEEDKVGIIVEEFSQKRKMKTEQRLMYRIIGRVLTVGISAMMGVEVSCQLHREIIQLCEQLHQTLAFQGLSISQILLKFISPLSKSISNLVFYQNLLKIFLPLDFYQIINFFQQTMRRFREDWQKKQKEIIQSTVHKANRQTRLLTSIKRNVSLEQDERSKENIQVRENVKSVSKVIQQQPRGEIMQSNFKKILTNNNKRALPSSSRRRTFNIDKAYRFNSRQSTSNLHQSTIERQKILKKQNYSWKDVGYENCGRNHCGEKYLGEEAEDVLADSTPNKKKKVYNKKN